MAAFERWARVRDVYEQMANLSPQYADPDKVEQFDRSSEGIPTSIVMYNINAWRKTSHRRVVRIQRTSVL